MEETDLLLFFQNHKKLNQIYEKEFVLFLTKLQKLKCNTWKKSIVIDFNKNTNFKLKCNTRKKDKFCCFNKITKIEVFYMEEENLYCFLQNHKKRSLLCVNNFVVLDFNKNK